MEEPTESNFESISYETEEPSVKFSDKNKEKENIKIKIVA